MQEAWKYCRVAAYLNMAVNATAEELLAMIQLFPRGSALPNRWAMGGGMTTRALLLLLALSALCSCATKVEHPGYYVKVFSDGYRYHSADHYLEIYPENDGSGVIPIRDEEKLRLLWSDLARQVCGDKIVEVAYGPHLTVPMSEYCEPFPGEKDCAPSAFGYLNCR